MRRKIFRGVAGIAILQAATAAGQGTPGMQAIPQVQVAKDAAAGEATRDFSVWMAHGVSDNLGEQTVGFRGSYDKVGILYSIDKKATHVSLGMATDLEFRHYSIDELVDEPIGTLDLLATLSPIPDKFNWIFQDDYGQTVTDPFHPNTVDNRESFNIAATGPQVKLPIGKRTALALSSIYSDRNYESSNTLDSSDINTEIGIIRQASRSAELGLVAHRSEIQYDFDLPGYDIDSLLLRYAKTLAAGAVLLEGGENALKAGDTEVRGPLIRARWERSVTARSRITLTADREFTDSGELFALGIGRINADHVQDILLSPNALEQERAAVRYQMTLNRSTVLIQLAKFTERYERDDSFDNNATDIQISLRRALTSRLNIAVDLGSLRRDFLSGVSADQDKLVTVLLTRDMGRHFQLGGLVERRTREGTDPFSRNLYEMRLTYRPRAL